MTVALLALLLSAIPDAPTEGVDADIRVTLDQVRTQLDLKDPSGDGLVLELLLAADRFSRAQVPRVKSECIALLREAGSLRVQHGEVELGSRDLDAAWLLVGKGMDLQLAAALAAWADKVQSSDPPAALWLARRALTADPANPLAQRVDTRLTNNPRRVLAYGLIGFGVAALISGVVFALVANTTTQRINDHNLRSRSDWDVLLRTNEIQRGLTVSSFVASGLAWAGGITLLASGKRNFVPTSPALLPALPEVKP